MLKKIQLISIWTEVVALIMFFSGSVLAFNIYTDPVISDMFTVGGLLLSFISVLTFIYSFISSIVNRKFGRFFWINTILTAFLILGIVLYIHGLKILVN